MSDILHSVTYDVVNEQNKDFIIQIYINDKLMLTLDELHTVQSKTAHFNYIYNDDDRIASLVIIISGEEQPQKMLRIKKITVNTQPLDIPGGFYFPDDSPWWQSLDPEQFKQERKRTLLHGGCLGWFGRIEYSYDLIRNKKRSKPCPVHYSLPKLKNKGIMI